MEIYTLKKKMLNSLAPMAKEKSRICLLGPLLIARVSQVSRSKPFFPLRTWTRERKKAGEEGQGCCTFTGYRRYPESEHWEEDRRPKNGADYFPVSKVLSLPKC